VSHWRPATFSFSAMTTGWAKGHPPPSAILPGLPLSHELQGAGPRTSQTSRMKENICFLQPGDSPSPPCCPRRTERSLPSCAGGGDAGGERQSQISHQLHTPSIGCGQGPGFKSESTLFCCQCTQRAGHSPGKGHCSPHLSPPAPRLIMAWTYSDPRKGSRGGGAAPSGAWGDPATSSP
jgi:hypothetical protein